MTTEHELTAVRRGTAAIRRLQFLLLVPLALCLCAPRGCGGGYEMEQYTPPEWFRPNAAYTAFTDVCTSHLCLGDPGCMGTDDSFILRVGSPAARDRFVFFQGGPQCAGPDGAPCTSQGPEPRYGSQGPLFDAPEGFRTGGRYVVYEGPGSIMNAGDPLHLFGQVGWVRNYHRGECSASDTLGEVPTIVSRPACWPLTQPWPPFEWPSEEPSWWQSTCEPVEGPWPPAWWGVGRRGIDYDVGNQICGEIESSPYILSCTVEERDVSVHLGTASCRGTTSPHRDFVHLFFRLRVQPHFLCGGFDVYMDFWWRFVAWPRTRYIDCFPGGACNQIVPCTSDADCADIPGARCGPSGLCWLDSFVDVTDIGIEAYNNGEDPIFGVGDFCHDIYDGTWDELAALEATPYDHFFSLMLGEMTERMWQVVDDPDVCPFVTASEDCACATDDDCFDLSLVRAATRCNAERHYCEVRPWDVYDVNLYPDEVEFVLATEREPGSRAMLSHVGLCDVPSEMVPELDSRWTH